MEVFGVQSQATIVLGTVRLPVRLSQSRRLWYPHTTPTETSTKGYGVLSNDTRNATPKDSPLARETLCSLQRCQCQCGRCILGRLYATSPECKRQ